MELGVEAIGFFFAALGPGVSHFSDIESAPAALPPQQANASNAKAEVINTEIRKRFTK